MSNTLFFHIYDAINLYKKTLLTVMWLPIAKLKIYSIRFLYFVKISKIITLKNIGINDIIENMAIDIILYRFISSIFNIIIFD